MVREGRVVVEVRRAVGRLALGGWLAGWLLAGWDWRLARERREVGEALSLRVGCSVYGEHGSAGSQGRGTIGTIQSIIAAGPPVSPHTV